MMVRCPKCEHPFNEPADLNNAAGDALRELVELKRMRDTTGATPEYERRKALAWREAFRVCGVLEDPKP